MECCVIPILLLWLRTRKFLLSYIRNSFLNSRAIELKRLKKSIFKTIKHFVWLRNIRKTFRGGGCFLCVLLMLLSSIDFYSNWNLPFNPQWFVMMYDNVRFIRTIAVRTAVWALQYKVHFNGFPSGLSWVTQIKLSTYHFDVLTWIDFYLDGDKSAESKWTSLWRVRLSQHSSESHFVAFSWYGNPPEFRWGNYTCLLYSGPLLW